MGELIGIATTLSVVNVMVIAYFNSLFKTVGKLQKYAVAFGSSATTVLAVKFLGANVLLLMEALFADVPKVELPDIGGLGWPQLGGLVAALTVISGGGWNLLKSFGFRKSAKT